MGGGGTHQICRHQGDFLWRNHTQGLITAFFKTRGKITKRITCAGNHGSIHKRRADDIELVVLNGIEYAQSCIGIVVAEKDHLHRLAFRVIAVHRQEPFDKRECHALFQNVVLMFVLIRPVGGETFPAEDRIRFIQFKKGAGCNADHQFILDLECHNRDPV